MKKTPQKANTHKLKASKKIRANLPNPPHLRSNFSCSIISNI